jgi:hypothetical protein
VKRTLVVAAAAAAIAACSSSNPCQDSVTSFNYGDCSDIAQAAADAGPVVTTAARNACTSACSSSADQTAVGNFFSCYNAVPGAVGACSMSMEQAWGESVVQKVTACESTAQAQLSSGCFAALSNASDGG